MKAKIDGNFYAVEKVGNQFKTTLYKLKKGEEVKIPKNHIALAVACGVVEVVKRAKK